MPVQNAAGQNTQRRPQESAREPPPELVYDFSSLSAGPGIPDISDWEEVQDNQSKQTEMNQSQQQDNSRLADKSSEDDSLGMVECSPDSVLGL